MTFKNKFLILFSIFWIISNIWYTKAEGEINISPIVQIISYYDIYWKYPQMMWWWSASLITKDGVIISNDHVVDSWNGTLAGAFSICITTEISKKPVCDYTASLISRDEKLDISMLKIDPVDIYWNKVDYEKFKTIDIDFDYKPKNQDETIAIGYPWIGADTISETKWIVSWISEYNGYKYIKTDTLIAWWNSGGAFIKDWKLIWIPTFWIGWWDSMWYALSIIEAKNFIEENLKKDSTKNPITNLIDFNSYRKTIENINSSFILQDDIFDVKLLSDYQVSNYIKNNSLNIELKKQKDTGVSYISVYLEKTPKINTDKEKFYYFETKWLYSKDWQKLIKKTLNGIDYYYPVDKTDLSDWNSNWWNSYFTIENWYLITIYLTAPFYDEKRNKEVKLEVEKLLGSIKIKKENFSKIITNFSTNIPKIDIKSVNNAIVDTWKYKFYLWNLYENFEIYLNELVEYNGKWKTAQEIYDVQSKDVDDSLKSMIKFNSLDWFITCGASFWNNYYNYYNYYSYNYVSYDEKWNPITLENCEINIFFPLNKDLNRHNYLSLKLTTLSNNKEKNLILAIEFLKRFLKTEWYSGETNIVNILKNQVKLKFKDIENQTKEYKNFLKLLVRYNMIENNSKFAWDSPITWWEYLDLYVNNIYKFDLKSSKCDNKNYKCRFTNYKIWDTSLDNIFNELWIKDYSEYIDNWKLSNFETILNYKLAWVDIWWEYNLENFNIFQNLIEEEKNVSEKQKINDFNHTVYGDKKILISDFYSNYISTYFTISTPKFYPSLNKLVYDKGILKIDFSSKRSIFDIEVEKLNKDNKCNLKSSYSEFLKCNKIFEEQYKNLQEKYLENKNLVWLEKEYSFIPLTKAQAIENIFTKVDFWLFDEKLAKKKDTVVE